MNWIVANHTWLFDGVGGAAVVAIVSLIIHRMSQDRSTPQTVIERSTLAESPVATGSGITQNVTSHHYYGTTVPAQEPVPVVAPQPKPITPVEPEKPQSPMIFTGCSIIPIARYDRGVWRDGARGISQNAMVLQFTNEARHGKLNSPRMVKASLVFKNGTNEVLRISGGCWVNEATDFAAFGVEESHRLIICIGGCPFRVIEQARCSTGLSDHIETKEHKLSDFAEVDVRVRLVEVYSNYLLYEGSFRITFDPPRIVPEGT